MRKNEKEVPNWERIERHLKFWGVTSQKNLINQIREDWWPTAHFRQTSGHLRSVTITHADYYHHFRQGKPVPVMKILLIYEFLRWKAAINPDASPAAPLLSGPGDLMVGFVSTYHLIQLKDLEGSKRPSFNPIAIIAVSRGYDSEGKNTQQVFGCSYNRLGEPRTTFSSDARPEGTSAESAEMRYTVTKARDFEAGRQGHVELQWPGEDAVTKGSFIDTYEFEVEFYLFSAIASFVPKPLRDVFSKESVDIESIDSELICEHVVQSGLLSEVKKRAG